jgi:hypothetical protein
MPGRSSKRCCENIDLGRPENAELLFRRGQRLGGFSRTPPGGFKTKTGQYCELVTMNVFYKSSRVKQYLKDGTARILVQGGRPRPGPGR